MVLSCDVRSFIVWTASTYKQNIEEDGSVSKMTSWVGQAVHVRSSPHLKSIGPFGPLAF